MAWPRIRPVLAWYDCWVGVYWERRTRRLYVLPLPCIGLMLEFSRRDAPRRLPLRTVRVPWLF